MKTNFSNSIIQDRRIMMSFIPNGRIIDVIKARIITISDNYFWVLWVLWA